MTGIDLELSVGSKKCSIKGLVDECGRINYTSINNDGLFWKIDSYDFNDFYSQLLKFQDRYKDKLYKIKMKIKR